MKEAVPLRSSTIMRTPVYTSAPMVPAIAGEMTKEATTAPRPFWPESAPVDLL